MSYNCDPKLSTGASIFIISPYFKQKISTILRRQRSKYLFDRRKPGLYNRWFEGAKYDLENIPTARKKEKEEDGLPRQEQKGSGQEGLAEKKGQRQKAALGLIATPLRSPRSKALK
jgi:hypothetical protein